MIFVVEVFLSLFFWSRGLRVNIWLLRSKKHVGRYQVRVLPKALLCLAKLLFVIHATNTEGPLFILFILRLVP